MFLAVAPMRYVNVPGADDFFTFQVSLLVSVAVTILAAALVGRGRRPTAAPTTG